MKKKQDYTEEGEEAQEEVLTYFKIARETTLEPSVSSWCSRYLVKLPFCPQRTQRAHFERGPS
jgi:hypothetical protein